MSLYVGCTHGVCKDFCEDCRVERIRSTIEGLEHKNALLLEAIEDQRTAFKVSQEAATMAISEGKRLEAENAKLRSWIKDLSEMPCCCPPAGKTLGYISDCRACIAGDAYRAALELEEKRDSTS